MQKSLFQKEYICPKCEQKVIPPESYANYFNCSNCNKPLSIAKDFINNSTNTYITMKEIKFVKWLIDNEYISENDLITAYKPTRGKFKDLYLKFIKQAKFDIIITNKSGGKYLCNEKVSYQEAKEICSREDTSFVNSFAGFVVHGTYSDIKEGEEFEI